MRMTHCEIGKIGLIDHDILLVDIASEQEISLEHINEFKHAAAEITTTRTWYSIVNYGPYSFPTKEAREKCTLGSAGNHVLAKAMVVHDLGQMILARHIVKQQKTKVPTKIFTDINKAEEWVKELRSKNHDNQPIAEKA